MTKVEDRMIVVLRQMAVLSEASGAQLGDTIHGGEKNNAPKGPRGSMAEYHARCWRRAKGTLARADALSNAEAALINARYAPRRSMVSGTLEWRLAIARDPRPAPVVAEVYGVSRQHVYRLRAVSARAATLSPQS